MKRLCIGLLMVLVAATACKTKVKNTGSCGDGYLDPGEECDKDQLAADNCYMLGYYDQHGTLTCRSDCTFDRSVCGARCGDGFVQVVHGEHCDGENLADMTCQALELGEGVLQCTPNCKFETSGCAVHAVCGDGVIAYPYEKCEGENLYGETCESRGYYGGILACATDCLSLDESDCATFGRCGDGVRQPAMEDCEGLELVGETCESQGFVRGTLACTEQCRFDTSGCEMVSADADLARLEFTPGVLTPFFGPELIEYTAVVPAHVNEFSVFAEKAHVAATLSVSTPSPIAIGEDPVVVTITVVAENGTEKVTTITVTKYDVPDLETPLVGTMRYVPPGTFQVDEQGATIATVSGFYIATAEVVRAAFLDAGLTDPSDLAKSSGTGDPVQRVNWYDTLVFCNKVSLQEGLTPVYSIGGSTNPDDWGPVPGIQSPTWDAVIPDWNANGYRLPTAMEWYWAAMGAGSQTSGFLIQFAGDSGANAAADHAWYRSNANGSTHQHSTRLPNELGLFDMSGNVHEWVWDWHMGGYPMGELVDYRGPATGTLRSKRGGSWWSLEAELVLHTLDNIYPNERDSSNGFRVVRRYLP